MSELYDSQSPRFLGQILNRRVGLFNTNKTALWRHIFEY